MGRGRKDETFDTPEENPLAETPGFLGWRMRRHRAMVITYCITWLFGIGMLVAALTTTAWWEYQEDKEVLGVAEYFEAGARVTQNQYWGIALSGMVVKIKYCVTETSSDCFSSVDQFRYWDDGRNPDSLKWSSVLQGRFVDLAEDCDAASIFLLNGAIAGGAWHLHQPAEHELSGGRCDDPALVGAGAVHEADQYLLPLDPSADRIRTQLLWSPRDRSRHCTFL